MKKSIKFLAAALLIISCIGAFAACGKSKNKHTHSFGTEWKSDAAQHWHECTGKDCAEKSGEAGHGFTYTKTATQHTATCSVCGYSAGAADHTLSFGVGGAKGWEQSCVCGHKTGEVDYTKMSLAQFFTEISKNEGNYIVDCVGEDGDYKYYWEISGKNSYFSNKNYDYEEYLVITENGVLLYDNNSTAEWAQVVITIYDTEHNLWLGGDDGCILTDECIDNGYGITANDFKAGDTANTYVLKDGSKEIWWTSNYYTCEIIFSKENIVVEFVTDDEYDAVTYTYTITLGDCPTIVFPPAVQALHDTVMMFGIAPDSFAEKSGKYGPSYEWGFTGVDKVDEFFKLLVAEGWTFVEENRNGYTCVFPEGSNPEGIVGTNATYYDNQMWLWFKAENGSGYQFYFYKMP